MAKFKFFLPEQVTSSFATLSPQALLMQMNDELVQLQSVHQSQLVAYEKQSHTMLRAHRRVEKSKDPMNVEKSFAFITKNQPILDESKKKIDVVEARIERLTQQINQLLQFETARTPF